jgi:hypothetical protein
MPTPGRAAMPLLRGIRRAPRRAALRHCQVAECYTPWGDAAVGPDLPGVGLVEVGRGDGDRQHEHGAARDRGSCRPPTRLHRRGIRHQHGVPAAAGSLRCSWRTRRRQLRLALGDDQPPVRTRGGDRPVGARLSGGFLATFRYDAPLGWEPVSGRFRCYSASPYVCTRGLSIHVRTVPAAAATTWAWTDAGWRAVGGTTAVPACGRWAAAPGWVRWAGARRTDRTGRPWRSWRLRTRTRRPWTQSALAAAAVGRRWWRQEGRADRGCGGNRRRDGRWRDRAGTESAQRRG